MPDERFDARFNATQSRRNRSGWDAVLVAVATLARRRRRTDDNDRAIDSDLLRVRVEGAFLKPSQNRSSCGVASRGALNKSFRSGGISRLSRNFAAAFCKALPNQRRPSTFAGHPFAELRVVVFAASHLAHAVHHALRAIREVRFEPLHEQRRNFPRQAKHRVVRLPAPASAAASSTRSISGSLMNGIIGATLTVTGMPAAANVLTVRSRAPGLLRAAPECAIASDPAS